MALSPIVQDIATSLEAKGVILASKVFEGPEHLHEHADYPRVVFVPGAPGQDQIGPSPQVGGNARQRATIYEMYSVYCWAVDYAATRALRTYVVEQCIATAGGMSKDSLLFGTGGFTDKTIHDQRGKEYVFTIKFGVPVNEVAYTNAPAGVGQCATVKMIFTNSEVVGCSDCG